MKARIFCLCLVCLVTACGKSGGNAPAAEAPLVFTISPDPGTTVFPALASNQDIAVTITSKLPAAGVTADIMVTKDLDNSTVFSSSATSTISGFSMGIQNLPNGALCTVIITITSKSTASNKVSKTFKIAKK